MTISRILAVKGRHVVTTTPDQTLEAVSHTLSEKGIGAIIVTNAENQVLGILSERDIVRAIARHGVPALQDKVSSHMTSKVVSATEESSIISVMEQMSAGRFRHVPVMKGERLVGLVSIGDVVKHRLAEIESEHQAMREYIAAA